MDLKFILGRFAEAIPEIDSAVNTARYNQRTGEIYRPGVKTMTEPHLVESFRAWWLRNHPEDFDNPTEARIACEVRYRNTPRAKCDMLISVDNDAARAPDWAIEIKNINLVGDNGKTNDYCVPKMLSPYLKDRSLKHDVERLIADPFCAQQGVIGYSFEYSFETLAEAQALHSNDLEVLNQIREVCRKVDPIKGEYSPRPLIDFADEILVSMGLVKPALLRSFENAWRHPAGGYGLVFGWNILSSEGGMQQ